MGIYTLGLDKTKEVKFTVIGSSGAMTLWEWVVKLPIWKRCRHDIFREKRK